MRSTTAASLTRTSATTLENAPTPIWSASTSDVVAARDRRADENDDQGDGLGAARGIAFAIATGAAFWLSVGAGAFALFQLLS